MQMKISTPGGASRLPSATTRGSRRALGRLVVGVLAMTIALSLATTAPAAAAAPAAPSMFAGPTAVTTGSISVRFLRSADPDLVCKPDIGYEVLGGAYLVWRDVGGFPNAPCDDRDPGYKFSGLSAGTTYTLSIRAYRLTAGVKEYSAASSMTATTTAGTATPPTSGASVNPPSMYAGPTAVTTSSISVRFLRSPAPDRVCKPDIGYEVMGGASAGWLDVGGFPNAPCDDPDPGYKFSGLMVNTTYTLSIRAYRVTNGVKEYSTASSTTVTTKGVNPATLLPTPIAVSDTSISIRFIRSPAPDRVCKPDIGYEVRGGAFAGWLDVGGFPNAPCDDPDIGYKFSGLSPATSYTLSLRTYRITAGVKEYAPERSLTASTLGGTPPTTPPAVNAPSMSPLPTAVSPTSISVRFYRSATPDLVCKPDIGYEVIGGAYADWHDVGGFPNAPCDDPDIGLKFSGLASATTYTLSIRAYRITNGVKEYSSVSGLTAATLPPPTV